MLLPLGLHVEQQTAKNGISFALPGANMKGKSQETVDAQIIWSSLRSGDVGFITALRD